MDAPAAAATVTVPCHLHISRQLDRADGDGGGDKAVVQGAARSMALGTVFTTTADLRSPPPRLRVGWLPVRTKTPRRSRGIEQGLAPPRRIACAWISLCRMDEGLALGAGTQARRAPRTFGPCEVSLNARHAARVEHWWVMASLIALPLLTVLAAIGAVSVEWARGDHDAPATSKTDGSTTAGGPPDPATAAKPT